MCIIVCKPSGTAMPSKDVIKTCFANNADGFGLAYSYKGKVFIAKGAMTETECFKLIDTIPDPLACGVVMHFRLATHGKVCPGNCHPFPITRSKDMLQATELSVNCAIAHNGVLTGYSPAAKKTEVNGVTTYDWQTRLSDTMVFIRDTLGFIGEGNVPNKGVRELISLTGSIFAILTAQMIYMLGTGWIKDKDDGCFYSNNSYKWARYSYGSDTFDDELSDYIHAVRYLSPANTEYCDVCGELVTEIYDVEGAYHICPTCFFANDPKGKGGDTLNPPPAGGTSGTLGRYSEDEETSDG